MELESSVPACPVSVASHVPGVIASRSPLLSKRSPFDLPGGGLLPLKGSCPLFDDTSHIQPPETFSAWLTWLATTTAKTSPSFRTPTAMTTTPATGAPHTTPNHKRPSKMASSQSLNHLLNFSLPPRQSHLYQNLPRRRKQGGNQAVWNKEREYRSDCHCRYTLKPSAVGFVNAQYRFVMDPMGDYTVHFADPDMYVRIVLRCELS